MRPFKSILCAVSTEQPHPATVARAVSLAQNSQARLTFVDVVPRLRAGIMLSGKHGRQADLQATMAADRLQALQSMTRRYQDRVDIHHEVLTGTGFLEIIRAVLRDDHDLVLKPAENPGFIQRMFGSDDMQLLRACPCPVWITRPEEDSSYDSILVAIDVNADADTEPEQPPSIERDLNQQLLALGASLALSDFASLEVLHVWDAPGEALIRTWSDDPGTTTARYVHDEYARHQQALDDVQTWLRDYLGDETFGYLSPRFHLRRGMPSTAIPHAARELRADGVLMGTVARGGIAGLLIGNTAEAILEQLTCSVVAVKPAGFVSPVRLREDQAGRNRS